ncbi:MAG TPA: crosslink repair DNA glycosylase YcaQ family protein [Actinomycetota bacterium]|nr:crosslink repair DNA glycosylase YcaQ family protein [Actinomycetota bacterium]
MLRIGVEERRARLGLRHRLARPGATSEEVELDEGAGYVLPDDLEPAAEVEPWVALLPALDPTVMGSKNRAWYLGEHGAELFDRNGNAEPTVWANRRVVGGWIQTAHGDVVIELIDRIDTATRRMIHAERDRLQAWLGNVRIKARFPTPVERRLANG